MATDLGRGVYTPAEAARIADLTPRRARRWLAGYSYVGTDRVARHSSPVFDREHHGEDLALTFMDLVELLFVRTFLQHGVSMPRIRRIEAEARQEIGVRHPFATKKFETDGKSIFHRFVHDGRERVEDRWTMQQVETQIFNPLLSRLDYDDATRAARRFWPLGKDRPVVFDPHRSFGEAVVAKTHVPTRVLYKALRGGKESALRVSRWFGVELAEVEAASAYEESIDKRARTAA
jgi:uncharacterized protein (DUF433 family)